MARLVCGIDEAGRGSVIGPMVIAGVLIEEEKIDDLVRLKVRDSKELKPEERERIYDDIMKTVKSYEVVVLTAREVDSKTRKNKMKGINYLEAKVFAKIINDLKPDVVYIDLPTRDVKKFELTISEMLKHQCILVLEHKADKKYPVTSAASIVAKVTRDREIEKLRERFGDFGSGYPHDPETRKFIREVLGSDNEVREYVRWSWKTINRVAQTKLEEYESERG